jgi:signal transduction histidine kinase
MEQQLKILIVDDKPQNLFALGQNLKVLEAEVITASCGNDALIASLNHDFALAIIDVQMPEMDGYELAELLRGQGQTRHLPIMFLSAVYREDYYVFRGYEAGAVDFIIKPYHPDILLGKVAVFLDLARQRIKTKQMAEELRLANEVLEQRVRERTELAEARANQLQALAVELIEAEERERRRIAEMLHDDLQQLLACARLQLQSACEGLPTVPALTFVEQLLVESIAKSRRLSHELSPAVLHHSGLIVALQWLARQMEEQFGLQVEIEAGVTQPFENTPLKIFLFRAVQELLFNVVKHAGVKSARVVLSESAAGLVTTVSDQGQGFNPAILGLPAVLTGFGLLGLRERARYVGGSFTMESAPGRGSRFSLTIPVLVENGNGPQQMGPLAGHQPRNPARGPISAAAAEHTRVLFADDHKVMRQGLIRLISGQPDIQVVGEAADGREALEKTRQLQPDVVVMDIAMPVMDGVEATRRIKAEMPGVRVIGLSMYEEEQLAQTMRLAGAEAFLSKTASSAELLTAIYGISHPLKIGHASRKF